MEIFNIHIFEFVLIAALALVIFGPERLPEVGRFIGKQVARFLAWQQQSPELKMINEIRSEFEQEIGTLRDELVRTRQQLDVQQNVKQLESEVKSALDVKNAAATPSATAKASEALSEAAEQTIAPPRPSEALASGPEAVAAPDLPAPPGDVVAASPDLTPPIDAVAQSVPTDLRPNKLANSRPAGVLNKQSDLPPLPRHRQNLHDSAHLDEPATTQNQTPETDSPAAVPTTAELSHQIAALSAELNALQSALRARGVLTDQPSDAAASNGATATSVAEETFSR
ncbi:MAG: translocase [Oscillochloris sp.]|nr:translocase [Oscillochloris sp.]